MKPSCALRCLKEIFVAPKLSNLKLRERNRTFKPLKKEECYRRLSLTEWSVVSINAQPHDPRRHDRFPFLFLASA